METIENKVSKSGLVSLNLDDYYPEGPRMLIDLKDQLWQGMVLKEKDFREWIKNTNWGQFKNCHVAVHCSADAIVPSWSYMLVASKLSGIAKTIEFGDLEHLETVLWEKSLSTIQPEKFTQSRIVVKGCGKHPSPPSAFVNLVSKLQPFAKSIMYGEPCSTVPIWKRSK